MEKGKISELKNSFLREIQSIMALVIFGVMMTGIIFRNILKVEKVEIITFLKIAIVMIIGGYLLFIIIFNLLIYG